MSNHVERRETNLLVSRPRLANEYELCMAKEKTTPYYLQLAI